MSYEAPPPGASGSAANGTVQVCNSSDLAKSYDSSGFVVLRYKAEFRFYFFPFYIHSFFQWLFFFWKGERKGKRFDVVFPGDNYAS